ncbi:hypothetical protein KGA66_01520 [Actinocrinis puniceicyclus]|uniref:Uncharacterized protein n=1 Tax=Actinocrinis puniceicyclus TaxID=977794 RepID=A0A8J7WGF8_9ACTN|nr:hypothetical protein [Actinocrinis puniceicyclus]MBS2961708.1 hypothetical protein [Actinocrinis puniceicyclus]
MPDEPRETPAAGRAAERPDSGPNSEAEHLTLREPFTATGETFAVPVPDYPTLQEATVASGPEHPRASARQRPKPSTRGAADPVSIGVGLVFFLLGGAYLLASGGHLTVNAGWTGSFLLLGLGLSGVVGAFVRARRESHTRSSRGDR